MQVSVETGEGLERKLTVQVPAETVESEVNNRLNSLKNTVRVDGFRPGKVPLKVVKQKYSGTVLQEVAGEWRKLAFTPDALSHWEQALDWPDTDGGDRSVFFPRFYLIAGRLLLAEGRYGDAVQAIERGRSQITEAAPPLAQARFAHTAT